MFVLKRERERIIIGLQLFFLYTLYPLYFFFFQIKKGEKKEAVGALNTSNWKKKKMLSFTFNLNNNDNMKIKFINSLISLSIVLFKNNRDKQEY